MNEKNKIDVLVGLQWGDEGKGKIVDMLTPKYDVVARFQGGPNAGHTLEFNNQKHVLHLIPSGIFHPDKVNLLGNGMVIDPIAFQKEVEGLRKYIPMEELKKRIVIASGAKLILPVHRILDGANEEAKGDKKIGTTKKGIGPAYTDHVSRNAVLVQDILKDTRTFTNKVNDIQEQHCIALVLQNKKCWDAHALLQELFEFFDAARFMQRFEIVNGPYWLDKQLREGKKVLAEGAQGTLLDINFGSYPFVTSSNTTCGGVCTGLGIAPNRIGKVYGLFKAYCTRVGSGPFPTELGGKQSEEWCATETVKEDATPCASINDPDPFLQGIALRRKGYEFGATTGRLRRCGWLDLPALKYACMINGVTNLIMSKADILSGFETVKICNNYLIDGGFTDEMPMEISELFSPQYKKFPGWDMVTPAKTTPFAEYLKFIENETGLPISIISTGPDRNQIFIRE